ncbi:MAG: RNA methyltransferase [Phycisphaeraceae bacterium]|nr:RNA methyltransferase [Phycisphaeraceae bacterium]
MPTHDQIAELIRTHVKRRRGVFEKNMFGGTAFMVNGNMFCGTVKDKLVVRLGNEGAAEALREPHTSKMTFTGKAIRSMVYVDARKVRAPGLRKWIDRGLSFARTLPAK